MHTKRRRFNTLPAHPRQDGKDKDIPMPYGSAAGNYRGRKRDLVWFCHMRSGLGDLRAFLQVSALFLGITPRCFPPAKPRSTRERQQRGCNDFGCRRTTSQMRDQNLPPLRETQLNHKQLPGITTSAYDLSHDFSFIA